MKIKEINEFLFHFNSGFKIKEWCFEKVIYIEDCKDYKFYNSKIYHKEHDVSLEKVIGTDHFSYVDRRWIDLLGNMKKSKSYWNKENFLEFIKTPGFSSGYSYAKFGDSYFVVGGNHRNCEAKFSELKSVRVPVTEYILDVEMLDHWNLLNKERFLPIIEDGHNRVYYRTFKWTLTVCQEKIIFHDFEAVKRFITHYKKIKMTIKESFCFFLQDNRLLSKGNEAYYRISDDYNQLNYFIYKHKKNK
ncbi:hypothetical protein OA93_23425 [Flavobacterium sp. KMS]|uniref:hypothetical protein n=1 Tax=Flavobacterium sp. KMS TaxID=1566023 RepID=UPI00057EE85A|nr:hypothetical protein [Flavobacterium sp. KMS]KIA92485.1 hypothetical protein OA93_23425 [Flavobacterium sp. KMS]